MSLILKGRLAIDPDAQDRYGLLYSAVKVRAVALTLIKNNQFFEPRAKYMTKDIDKATALVSEAETRFNNSINNLVIAETNLTEKTKQVSGKIKDATQKLSDGIAKVEKTANFDRLERYTDLLERAAAAMKTLAELDKNGQLSRIAAALK